MKNSKYVSFFHNPFGCLRFVRKTFNYSWLGNYFKLYILIFLFTSYSVLWYNFMVLWSNIISYSFLFCVLIKFLELINNFFELRVWRKFIDHLRYLQTPTSTTYINIISVTDFFAVCWCTISTSPSVRPQYQNTIWQMNYCLRVFCDRAQTHRTSCWNDFSNEWTIE